MNVVILMPVLFHGGAETQFRRLFENIPNSYIAAIDKSKDVSSLRFKSAYKNRIVEYRLFFNLLPLRFAQTYLNIIIAAVYYKIKLNGNNLAILYGSEARWLLLYPIFKLMGYKIMFSERNDGKHKWEYLYHLMGKCDLLSANSIEAKAIISQHVKKEVSVINNGISIPPYNQFKQFKIKDHYKILVPARISRLKDQEVVIAALNSINNIEVHFAGKVDEYDYYQSLLNKILECGYSNFVFDGYIENMLEYYKTFDFVLLPSHVEGTANVLLESMSYQIPCIASNIEMNRRLLHNSLCLFEVGKSQSLKECILRIINGNPKIINEIVKNNYDYVQENYSIEKMVSSYLVLFNNLKMK